MDEKNILWSDAMRTNKCFLCCSRLTAATPLECTISLVIGIASILLLFLCRLVFIAGCSWWLWLTVVLNELDRQ